MTRTLFSFWLLAGAMLAQQYRAQLGGAPPDELAAPVREALQSEGVRVSQSGATFCEVWFRTAPLESGSLEEALNQGSIPQGALVGAIRYHDISADRSGRGFPAGLYTLRSGGGDTIYLVPASEDQDPAPSDQSGADRRALRLSKGPGGNTPRLEITRGGEWILHARLGETPAALLVTGVAKR